MNLILIYTTIFLLWIVYASYEGFREAYYYFNTMTSNKSNKKNLHPIFFLQRGMILTMIYFALNIVPNNLLNGLMLIFILALVFPIFHDGFYYLIRHRLDYMVYQKGFWDDSTTSTAILEIKVNTRIFMFLIGLALMVLLILKMIRVL